MTTNTTLALELNPAQLHVLIRALDTYVVDASTRAAEARENNGRTRFVPDEGIPARGLDVDKMNALIGNAESLVDVLVSLIPADEPITATYEDGTPIGRDTVQGFPVPGSTALHLRRQLDALDDPASRGISSAR